MDQQYTEFDDTFTENSYKNLFNSDPLSFDMNENQIEFNPNMNTDRQSGENIDQGQLSTQDQISAYQHDIPQETIFIQENVVPQPTNVKPILPKPTSKRKNMATSVVKKPITASGVTKKASLKSQTSPAEPNTQDTKETSKKSLSPKKNQKVKEPISQEDKESNTKKRKNTRESNATPSKIKKTSQLFGIDLDRVNENNYYFWMFNMMKNQEDDIMTNTCKMLIIALKKNIIANTEKVNINFIQHMFNVKTKSDIDKLIHVIRSDSVADFVHLELTIKDKEKIITFLSNFMEYIKTDEHQRLMNFVKNQESKTKKMILFYYWTLNFVSKKLKPIIEDTLGTIMNDFYLEECNTKTCN